MSEREIPLKPKIRGNNCWYLPGIIQGYLTTDLLLDSGSSSNILPEYVYRKLPKHLQPVLEKTHSRTVTGFSGEEAKVLGNVRVTFQVFNQLWDIDFLVVDGAEVGILGVKFLNKYGIIMDYCTSTAYCKEAIPKPNIKFDEDTCLIVTTEKFVGARSEAVLKAKCPAYPIDSTVMVETTMQDFERGLVLARTLSKVDKDGLITVRFMNPLTDPVRIDEGMRMGKVSPVDSVLHRQGLHQVP